MPLTRCSSWRQVKGLTCRVNLLTLMSASLRAILVTLYRAATNLHDRGTNVDQERTHYRVYYILLCVL